MAALENAGVRTAGPEYVELSKMFLDQHRPAPHGARPSPDEVAVQRLASTALELLAPLTEAAALLAAEPRVPHGRARGGSATRTG